MTQNSAIAMATKEAQLAREGLWNYLALQTEGEEEMWGMLEEILPAPE